MEKYGFLGGAATTSQVLAYCGFFQQGAVPVKAVGGAADLVLEAMRDIGMNGDAHSSETTGNWIILLNPEGLKLALDRVLAAHGVDVLLHTRVAAATRTASRIESVTLAGMEGRRRITAEGFVDATGDANLSLVAGVAMREIDGPLQAVSAPIRIAGCTRMCRLTAPRSNLRSRATISAGGFPSPVKTVGSIRGCRAPGICGGW